MKLQEIKEKDLIFTNEIEDDRTNTYLTLNDYDWMNYILKTKFRTKNMGILNITFEYLGFTKSTMNIIQTLNKEEVTYNFDFNSNIFTKYLKEFLLKHLEQWEDKNAYAFNGEDIVIKFFNEVLNKGTLKEEEA